MKNIGRFVLVIVLLTTIVSSCQSCVGGRPVYPKISPDATFYASQTEKDEENQEEELWSETEEQRRFIEALFPRYEGYKSDYKLVGNSKTKFFNDAECKHRAKGEIVLWSDRFNVIRNKSDEIVYAMLTEDKKLVYAKKRPKIDQIWLDEAE